jgi:hypothetical protein
MYKKWLLEKDVDYDAVADQGPEPILYTMKHTLVGRQLRKSKLFTQYMERFSNPEHKIFYVEPHKELVQADGRRPGGDLQWGEVKDINGMLFDLLESHDIDYHPIGSLNPYLRTRNIRRELGPPKKEIDISEFIPNLKAA